MHPAATERRSGGMMVGRLEPPRTIYGPCWAAASRALGSAAPADQPLLHELLIQIEAGWVFVRPVLEIAHTAPERIDRSDAVGLFAVETAELFRSLAETCAAWIPCGGAPDTDSMEAELSRFATHAAVLALAAHAAGIDPLLHGVLQRLAREAPTWSDAMTTIVRRLGERWDDPGPVA